MTGQVLGWAAFAVVLVVLIRAACRPTVPADKPRHWSLDRRPDGLPREHGVSMHPARAAAWLVIATALAVLLVLGAGFSWLLRPVTRVLRKCPVLRKRIRLDPETVRGLEECWLLPAAEPAPRRDES